MSRHNRMIEGLIHESIKIRKRGCSSSSSTSSKVHNYRFKRAILVGKTRGGLGSKSSTPVPTWKTTSSGLRGGAVESPKYECGGGKSRPVSARKMAATLWEMNEIPSPSLREDNNSKLLKRREKLRSVLSGSLPPHLSDPSHSPVSERMDRSVTASRQRRTPSVSQRHRLADQTVGLDSLSNASLMEIETRSRAQTPSGSVVGVRTHLKDVINALTTSKELLKILNRLWAHNDPPSSSMSLITALHAELERVRLQVNQVIKEQRTDQNEITYLLKCFAEEKAAWKNKERQAIESAIESIAGELEAERKLRMRFESLNKKLGRELAEIKVSFTKAVKELESEKRAREIMEQVCDELASDVGEDKAEVEELKRVSAKVHEQVERESKMLHLADKLREERVQTKHSEAKHQFKEKNTAVDKLRNQLEAFLRPKKGQKKGIACLNVREGDEISNYAISRVGSRLNEEKEYDGGEVEDGVVCEVDSAESDLHSIELNMDNNNKQNFKWTHASAAGCDSRRFSVDDEMRGRNFVSSKVPRKSTSIQRSGSAGVEWNTHMGIIQNAVGGLDEERFSELEKQAQRKGYADEMHRYKSAKGLRDQMMLNSGIEAVREFLSPGQQRGQSRPSRDPGYIVQEKPYILVQESSSKSRLREARGGQSTRGSKC